MKQWSSNPPVWLLHLVDHVTRYSSSCATYTKKKEEIVRKLFQHWVTIFGVSNKYLVDNGGEFATREFITYCENMNVQICTIAAESMEQWIGRETQCSIRNDSIKSNERC